LFTKVVIAANDDVACNGFSAKRHNATLSLATTNRARLIGNRDTFE